MNKLACLTFVSVALVSAILTSRVAAQTGAAQEPSVKLHRGDTVVRGECLTQEELDLNAGLRALKRPTRGVEHPDADDQPRFNPHYFVGKWTIDGVVPESALGPAGEFTGVETIRHVDRCTYEGTITGKSADTAFTAKVLMMYDRAAGYMVRSEQDSRGFHLLKPGVLGGDAGGYFTHHWEAAHFTYKGRKVWLRGSTFLASPENYRLRMQISEDGQRFVNFGTIWWRRDGPATP